jgi:NAD dependent epimerase/dehydratase
VTAPSVLVTGAAGFIGSHLTELLVEQGYRVRALVRYNSRNDWGWLEDSPIAKNVEVVLGDVRDFDAIYRAMKGCDAVFHLAALVGIPYSYESPLPYVRTNVEGTYNVLEAARQLSLSDVIVTSTSETYGTAQYVPVDERHPLVAQSPYSATKIAADQLALSYHRSFGLPVKIVRPFNTYGPRQSARAIVPTIAVQILSGVSPIRLGSLSPTRDLTFVKDTARGFHEIYRSNTSLGEITNVGTNSEISVGELVETIARILGVDATVVQDDQRVRPVASEVERLRCDNSKIRRLTEWRPLHSLEQGLGETIEWLRRHQARYKPELYTS